MTITQHQRSSSCCRDTDHSFWVPRLAGKTDLIPSSNSMWIDPHQTGLYLGQCAQSAEPARQDALACYVQSRDEFSRWFSGRVSHLTQETSTSVVGAFSKLLPVSTVTPWRGPLPKGALARSYAPDEQRHIAAGATTNTPQHLRLWIRNPDTIKPGSLMPACS